MKSGRSGSVGGFHRGIFHLGGFGDSTRVVTSYDSSSTPGTLAADRRTGMMFCGRLSKWAVSSKPRSSRLRCTGGRGGLAGATGGPGCGTGWPATSTGGSGLGGASSWYWASASLGSGGMNWRASFWSSGGSGLGSSLSSALCLGRLARRR